MFTNGLRMLRSRVAMRRHASTRRLLAAGLGITLAVGIASPAGASHGWGDVIETGETIREIVYPVDGDAYYSDTWLAPRGGNRRHVGVDIMGDKGTPLLAARAGCITYLDYGGPGGGNMLTLTDADGWQYRYIHINNDTPGTDDGANPYEWAFTVEEGDCVAAGQHIAFMGDSGNAESTGSHLHFEMVRDDGYWVNPYPSTKAAEERAACSTPDVNPDSAPDPASGRGYWLLDDAGRVHGYDAPHLGDLTTIGVSTPPASLTATASGEGYWIVDQNGLVHAFGDAEFFGDMRGWDLNGPVRRIEPLPTGDGYWLVADDGGVFAFGKAGFHGSMGDVELNASIISLSATPDGAGYFLVGEDGGVFTFGNAEFRGSTGGMALAAGIIDMAVPDSGSGYWLYAHDGGVFAFGGLAFHGSAPGTGRCDLAPSVALRETDTGRGYWIALSNGEVLVFGDAMHHGDRPELHIENPDDPEADLHAEVIDLAVRHTDTPVEPSGR